MQSLFLLFLTNHAALAEQVPTKEKLQKEDIACQLTETIEEFFCGLDGLMYGKPLVKVTPLLLTSKECDQFLQEWNLAAGFSGNLHLFEETNLDGEKLCIKRRDIIGMVNSQDLEMLNPVCCFCYKMDD